MKKLNVRYSILMEHLDLSVLQPGDEVLGTLPLQMASKVFQKGAYYYHLVVDTPFSKRGVELSAEDLERFGVRFEPFEVSARPLTVPYQQWLERTVTEFFPQVETDLTRLSDDTNGLLSDPTGIPVVVCIASDNNLPNWLVYKELSNRFASSDVHCWIVCSHSDRVIEFSKALRAEVLLDHAARSGATAREELVELFTGLPESYADAKTYLYERLVSAIASFQGKYQQKPRLLFNLTGGRKTMSFALNEVGRQVGAEMLYFHGNAGFEWIDPIGQQNGMQPIGAIAQPNTLLSLYGFEVEKPKLTPWHNRIANKIARLVFTESAIKLSSLNKALHDDGLFRSVKGKKGNSKIPVSQILESKNLVLKAYVENLLEMGALGRKESGEVVMKRGNAAQFLFRSGWFEVYFLDALARVIQHSGRAGEFSGIWSGNLRIENPNQIAREVDAMFLHGSNLWVVECKAKTGNDSAKVRDALDQVASLAFMLGGQNARSLVFYADTFSANETMTITMKKTNATLIQGKHCWPDRIEKSIAMALGLCEPDEIWLKQ